jgi:aspartate kinase
LGTKIGRNGFSSENPVKAITATNAVTLITVGGPAIVGVPDIAARTFAATAGVGTQVLMISQSSSQNDICLAVSAEDAGRTVEALRRTFAADLSEAQLDHIHVKPEVALVAVVGERMRGVPGISGRIFSTLGRERVNVIAIAQGSSEFNISFIVEAAAMPRAVSAIHEEFGLGRTVQPVSSDGASLKKSLSC